MTPRDPGTRAAGPFSWRFTAPLLLGASLNPVNSSLLATALTPIARSLDVPAGRVAVLVAALYLACAVAQPTAGKVAEEFGPRRVFMTGAGLVVAGAVLGATGGSLAALVAARVLIGIGTSAAYPTAMLLIRRRAADAGLREPPGRVLGALSVAGQATMALGLPVGGVLVGAAGWRWTFLVSIPFALAALAMTWAWIPRDPAGGRRGSARGTAARIDAAGIAGFGGAMTALLVFLMALPDVNAAALTTALVLGAALVAWELRAGNPFIDVRLLARNLALVRTYARVALTQLGVYSVMYGVTQWLEDGRGLSAEQAGLLVLPMSGLAVVITRPVARRNLVRGALVAASTASLLGSTGMLFLGTSAPVWTIVCVTLLFGVTVGTQSAGNQTALYTQAPAGQIGTASGLFRTFAYLGSIGSSTLTGVVFHDRVTDGGLHTIAIVLVGVSAAVLVMVLADRSLGGRARDGRAGRPEPDERHRPRKHHRRHKESHA
ncbi:MFS transporter [Streptomyces sp. RFCAC02]|uniref:MFS transporter n=1 Tax=Streptomyces sp. RFCAC02 TaxID=2499143 RepID=UPI00101F0AF9|nr:MFS transporter [Streptomyces sp. RFCAC02]